MASFVGRTRELGALAAELDRIASARDDRPGRCLLIRGRRRVGKSRLVERFVDVAQVPYLYFTAAGAGTATELRQLVADAAESTLPGRDLIAAANPSDWDAAFRLLAAALPDDTPSVVVLDEVPCLMDPEQQFEGILQRAWDRLLSRKPVLLVLIGSDLAMMEALNDYRRPFHQRGREMVLGPLNPADLATMLDLPPADAIDAALRGTVTRRRVPRPAPGPRGADRDRLRRTDVHQHRPYGRRNVGYVAATIPGNPAGQAARHR
ncbi:AAA family ATPase [Micromonospora sp. LOL_015]|uniref:AAA family ATPase n=1 Tax=Micromonospora sp. LOL_015 TaxID=3345416 RepID=UPI003A89F6F5